MGIICNAFTPFKLLAYVRVPLPPLKLFKWAEVWVPIVQPNEQGNGNLAAAHVPDGARAIRPLIEWEAYCVLYRALTVALFRHLPHFREYQAVRGHIGTNDVSQPQAADNLLQQHCST